MTLRKYFDPAFGVFLVVIFASTFNNYLQLKKQPTTEQTLTELTPTTNIPPTSVVPLETNGPTNLPKKPPQRTPIPTPKKTQTPAKTCIVTINGKRYDVERLRRTHSGGDVFVCNSDMTNTFKSEHGANYGLITPYLL